MKKGIKFSLCILGSGIGLAAAGWGLVCLLRHFGFMFRAWVGIVFFVIIVLLGFTLAGGIIYTLSKVCSLPQEAGRNRIFQKVLAVGGIVVTLGAAVIWGCVALFAFAFLYDQENVVEMYGQKMVSYEDNWHHTRVAYHEYKNFLVCGYKVIGRELYGGGSGYTYEFYDTQGNFVRCHTRWTAKIGKK